MISDAHPQIILASQSSGRVEMMQAAGIRFTAIPSRLDEDAIKMGLSEQNSAPRDIADALAEAKARKISGKYPEAFVVGSDQILVTPDGEILDKPVDKAMARHHLEILSGRQHQLISAVVICRAGRPEWRHIDTARLTMRLLDGEFIANYVDKYWDHIRHCVGCYRIEAEGAELFAEIKGDHHVIMGMPLGPVRDYLKNRGLLPS